MNVMLQTFLNSHLFKDKEKMLMQSDEKLLL